MSDALRWLRDPHAEIHDEDQRRLYAEAADELERLTVQRNNLEVELIRCNDDHNTVVERAERAESDREQLRAEAAALNTVIAMQDAVLTELEGWAHDGHLQTFEDRERFRKWVKANVGSIRALAKEEKPNDVVLQREGLRAGLVDAITGGIADRPLQIDQTK